MSSTRVLLRLTGYAWRHKWHLGAAYAAMMVATLSAVVIPRLLGNAIDEALTDGGRGQLILLAGAILVISVIRGIFSYGQSYLSEAISQRAAYDLRNDIFRKLQSLSFGYHDRQQTGNLMSRATQDVEAVRWFMSMGLVRGLSIVVMLGAVGALMVSTNWRLGIISMAFAPLVMWRAISMGGKLRPIWMRVQVETGHMTTVLQENLTGMRVVKAFGARAHEEAKFEKKASAVATHTYNASLLFASQGALMSLVLTLGVGAILLFGGREVVLDRLTPGELTAFILYMGLLAMPVRMIGWIVNLFSRASSAGQRLFEVLDAESPVEEKADARSMARVTGHVRFEKVSLSYGVGDAVVNDIDFEVEPGQMVAILGGPGSGKSTIVHLIPRFYEVSGGRITIDDTDIRDVTLLSLRKNVGIVFQDVFVFASTLRDNIAYGVDEASRDEVVSAARVAQLHEFAEGLPKGYETWIGERGITLSGGQRQRLAIARTILLDPPILILDDSTSSVDVGTEFMIQQALADVIKGRTTFVIAHRLSTVRKADLILVLDEGRIVERGTHKALMEMDGFYRRIYDLQLSSQAAAPLPSPAAPSGGDAT